MYWSNWSKWSRKCKAAALSLALVSMTALAGCGSDKEAKTTDNKILNVGIVQLVEHGSLDAANRGFVDGLKARGFEGGKNITLDQQNAQADQSNLQNIAQRFVSAKVDLICAISTPSAQSVASATTDIPVVGTAITDYEGAKLVKSNAAPGGNITGTSDMNPIKEQVDLLLRLYPNAKTIGTIYSSSEINSEIQVKAMTEYANSKGLTVKVATVSSVNDIQQAAQSIVNDVDVFYEPSDNVIASAMPTLASVTDAAGKGIICAVPEMVKAGGLATYGIDYYKLGVQTGHMAADILEGKKKPSEMPIETAKEFQLVVSKASADKIGLTIGEDILKDAEIVE